MNVLMTVISLVLVEIAGRKTLLLIGFVGMLLCTVALTVASLFVSTFLIISQLKHCWTLASPKKCHNTTQHSVLGFPHPATIGHRTTGELL